MYYWYASRYLYSFCCSLIIFTLICTYFTASKASDITLTLKGGGGFKINGALKAFDGKTYTIISPSFGRMDVPAARFDCESATCPTGPVKPALIPANLVRRGEPIKIDLSGSSLVGEKLMPKLLDGFAKSIRLKLVPRNGSGERSQAFELTDLAGLKIARISLALDGTGSGFRTLEANNEAIAMASRSVKTVEIARLQALGLGDMRDKTHQHFLAVDGLVLIVAPDSPVLSLSLDDVSKILSGKITDWSQLGYNEGRIRVVLPKEDSGAFDLIRSVLLDPYQRTLVETAEQLPDLDQVADAVSGDKSAFGIVSIGSRQNAKALNIRTVCGLVIPPSKFAMRSAEYPLLRRLYLYTAGRPRSALSQELVDYVASSQAQQLMADAGLVGRGLLRSDFEGQKSRIAFAFNAPDQDFNPTLMRTLLNEMKRADRLSFTFRFQTGSTELDDPSKRNVGDLVEAMTSGALKGASIRLLGFADADGSFQANLSLSAARARAVATAIRQQSEGRIGARRLSARGYGELAPVSCNTSNAGKRSNRRVEAWVVK